MFQRRVKDTFIQHWHSRLENSTRASFYRVFANFELQAYLKCVNIKKYKIALTKLRLSSHRLSIETGRWTNIPRENRLCTACNRLEDEYHLLFECQLYNNIRCNYIKKYYRERPSMFKTVDMLKSENANMLKKLAVYVFNAFEIRKTHVQI